MGHFLIIKDADFSSVAIERINVLDLKISINSEGLVTLSCFSASSIYYTTDGTTPTPNSTVYYSPFLIEFGITVKAIAVNKYGEYSDVVSQTYGGLVDEFKRIVPLTINEYGWGPNATPMEPDNVSACTPKVNLPDSLRGVLRFTSKSGYQMAIWTDDAQVAWKFFTEITINLTSASQIIVINVPVPTGQVQTSTDWDHYCTIEQIL